MRYDQDARMAAGEDRTLMIAVANPSGSNLTGMVAHYVMGKTPFGPEPALIQKSSTSGGIEISTDSVPPGFAVVLKVRLSNDDTALLAAGWYYHEASVVLASSAVITAMVGQMRLDPTWIASRL